MTDQTTRHTCNCDVCKGFTFDAPRGYIQGKHGQTKVHNYAQMLQNPMLRVAMERRGLKEVSK